MSASRPSTYQVIHSAYLTLSKKGSLLKIGRFLQDHSAAYSSLLLAGIFQAGMVDLSRKNPSLTSSVMNLIVDFAPDDCIVTELTAGSRSFPSLLHTAAHYGDDTTIRKLIDRGHVIDLSFDIDEIDGMNDCVQPIHIAAGFGSTNVLAQLIKSGVDINQRSGSGMTPLMYAIQHNNVKNIMFLLERKVSISDKDNIMQNALHLAATVRAESDIFMALLDRITAENINCLFDKDSLSHSVIQKIAIHKSVMMSLIIELLIEFSIIKQCEKDPISLNEFEIVCSLLAAGVDIRVMPSVSTKMVNNFNISQLANSKLKSLTPAKRYSSSALSLIELLLHPSSDIFLHPAVSRFLIYMRNVFQMMGSKDSKLIIAGLSSISSGCSEYVEGLHFDINMYTQQSYLIEFCSHLFRYYCQYISSDISSFSESMAEKQSPSEYFSSIAAIIGNINDLKLAIEQLGSFYRINGKKEDFIAEWLVEASKLFSDLNKAKEIAISNVEKRESIFSSFMDEPKQKKSKSSKNRKGKNKVAKKEVASPSRPTALINQPARPSFSLTSDMQSAFLLVPYEDAYLVGGAVFNLVSKSDSNVHDLDIVCAVDDVEEAIQELISRNRNAFYRPFPDKCLLQTKLDSGLKIDLLVRKKASNWLEIDQKERDFRVSMLYMNRLAELQPTPYLDAALDDIKHSRLVMIGQPDQRFNEDPVRVLRAIKLMAKGLTPDTCLKQALLNWKPQTELLIQHREHINAICRGLVVGEGANLFLQLLNEYQVIPRLLGESVPTDLIGLQDWLNLPAVASSAPVTLNEAILSYPWLPILPATTFMTMVTYMPVAVPVMVMQGYEGRIMMHNQQMPPPVAYYNSSVPLLFSPEQGDGVVRPGNYFNGQHPGC